MCYTFELTFFFPLYCYLGQPRNRHRSLSLIWFTC